MDKPEGKFMLGDHALYKDARDNQHYKLRIDKRDYGSLAKEWKYSGQAVPVKQEDGNWVEHGKSKILLNIREKELQLFA